MDKEISDWRITNYDADNILRLLSTSSWLLENVELPIRAISLAMSLLPLVVRVLMQCKSVVMQLEAGTEILKVAVQALLIER
jgi:hypothetical protein